MTLEPSTWLVDHAHLLPRSGDALDLASGRGRNALWLARRGLHTRAVDRNEESMAYLRQLAAQEDLPLQADVMDLEADEAPLATDAFELIVVVHYLHRPLFPALIAALRPGGILVYETFTQDQALRGKPTNPDFLLRPGELLELVEPLEVMTAREGDFEGKMLASVIARRR
jgi:SAM-dependent methyltransferase